VSKDPQPSTRERSPAQQIGIVGLGDIGGGVARHLLTSGAPLAVYDLRPEAIARFAQQARVASSPADLASHSDVLIVAVVNDAQVLDVLHGSQGIFAGASTGTSVIVVSTISTGTLLAAAADGRTQGISVIDCGVSGGPSAAAEGALVCMVGGDPAAVEQVRPVLELIGSLVLHMGPLGAGLSAKLARNVIQYGSWLAAYEGQLLAEAAGIDLIKLGQAVKASDARIGGPSTLMFRPTVAPWPERTDAGLLEAMRTASMLAHKDLDAARTLAASLSVEMPMAALTEEYCDQIFGLGTAKTTPS
jgi:3-hydroxyisobutyrate dehydrogenase